MCVLGRGECRKSLTTELKCPAKLTDVFGRLGARLRTSIPPARATARSGYCSQRPAEPPCGEAEGNRTRRSVTEPESLADREKADLLRRLQNALAFVVLRKIRFSPSKRLRNSRDYSVATSHGFLRGGRQWLFACMQAVAASKVRARDAAQNASLNQCASRRFSPEP